MIELIFGFCSNLSGMATRMFFFSIFILCCIRSIDGGCNVRSGSCISAENTSEPPAFYQLDPESLVANDKYIMLYKDAPYPLILNILSPLNSPEVHALLIGKQQKAVTFSQTVETELELPKIWTARNAPTKTELIAKNMQIEAYIFDIFEGPAIVTESSLNGDLTFMKEDKSFVFKKINNMPSKNNVQLNSHQRMLSETVVPGIYAFEKDSFKKNGEIRKIDDELASVIKINITEKTQTQLQLSLYIYESQNYTYTILPGGGLRLTNIAVNDNSNTKSENIIGIQEDFASLFVSLNSVKTNSRNIVTFYSSKGESVSFVLAGTMSTTQQLDFDISTPINTPQNTPGFPAYSNTIIKAPRSDIKLTVHVYEPGYLEITLSKGLDLLKCKVFFCDCTSHEIYHIVFEGNAGISEDFSSDMKSAKNINYDVLNKTLELFTGYTKIIYTVNTITKQHGGTPMYYTYVPYSYTVNGVSEALFKHSSDTQYTAFLQLIETKPGVIYVSFLIKNWMSYAMMVQVNDGYVTKIIPVTNKNYSLPQTYDIYNAERTLNEIITKVQQIIFQKNNDKVEFITNYSAGHILFTRTYEKPLPVEDNTNNKDKNSEYEGNKLVLVNLFPSVQFLQKENQISLSFSKESSQITYTVDRLWPTIKNHTIRSTVRSGLAFNGVYTYHTELQKKAFYILNNAEYISIDTTLKDNYVTALKFFFKSSFVEINFDSPIKLGGSNTHPTVGQKYTYELLPESYIVNSVYQDIFSGQPKTKAYLDVYKKAEGLIEITLNLIDKIQYYITYQPQDGWVTSKWWTIDFYNNNIPTGASTELQNNIHKIISTVQQISFEIDGRLQFITNNYITRLSFQGPYTSIPTDALVSESNCHLSLLDLQNSNENKTSSFQCSINYFRPGYVSFTCSEPKYNGNYIIQYNIQTEEVQHIQVTVNDEFQRQQLTKSIRSTTHVYVVKSHLSLRSNEYLLDVYSTNPNVNFLSSDALTNVPVQIQLYQDTNLIISKMRKLETTNNIINILNLDDLSVNFYELLPETYSVNGSVEKIYSEQTIQYPLIITINQNTEKCIKVTLYGKMIHTLSYELYDSDKHVTNIQYLGSIPVTSVVYPQPNILIPEEKIMKILNSVQQIIWTDKIVHFISDNGSTSVSFLSKAVNEDITFILPGSSQDTKYLNPMHASLRN